MTPHEILVAAKVLIPDETMEDDWSAVGWKAMCDGSPTPPPPEREALRIARAVIEDAATGMAQLQVWYDSADKERRETGGIGSQHRDIFEAWLDNLAQDAAAILARIRSVLGETT